MAILMVSALADVKAARPAVASTAAMAVDVRRDSVIRSSSIYVWVIPGRVGMTGAIEQHPRGEAPPDVANEKGPKRKSGLR
ncbi:hypothetical protein GCM10009080_52480 [Cupriavidus pauculus]|jgi:hypothetical protein